MSQVTPKILLGGKNDARKTMQSPGDVSAILNVSDKCFYLPQHERIVFEHVPMCDYGTTPLSPELVCGIYPLSLLDTCMSCGYTKSPKLIDIAQWNVYCQLWTNGNIFVCSTAAAVFWFHRSIDKWTSEVSCSLYPRYLHIMHCYCRVWPWTRDIIIRYHEMHVYDRYEYWYNLSWLTLSWFVIPGQELTAVRQLCWHTSWTAKGTRYKKHSKSCAVRDREYVIKMSCSPHRVRIKPFHKNTTSNRHVA